MARMKKGEGDESRSSAQGSVQDYEKMTIEDTFTKLSSNANGLTDKKAKERITRFGPNDIEEKKANPALKFLGYFYGPIPIMIIVAVILSAIIGSWDDFFIILALLFSNAFVGFYQERKAGNAIELLKQKLAPNARVLRDGKWTQIPSKELVPGDVVRVRLGDIVPADIKLIKGQYLDVDQSALTGESLSVEKAKNDISYSGSIVRKGEMDAIVVATGSYTYFGKTTKLVEEAKTSSHFQRNVVIDWKLPDNHRRHPCDDRIHNSDTTTAKHPGYIAVRSRTYHRCHTGRLARRALCHHGDAISLAKKEAIVSKLVAIEEMAGMDVLCSDKTGTITQKVN